MTEPDLQWQDPPTSRKAGKYARIAAELKKRPGKWALINTATTRATTTTIRQGKWPAFAPGGTFEAAAAKRPDGKYDIYARYVGGAE